MSSDNAIVLHQTTNSFPADAAAALLEALVDTWATVGAKALRVQNQNLAHRLLIGKLPSTGRPAFLFVVATG